MRWSFNGADGAVKGGAGEAEAVGEEAAQGDAEDGADGDVRAEGAGGGFEGGAVGVGEALEEAGKVRLSDETWCSDGSREGKGKRILKRGNDRAAETGLFLRAT